MAILKLKNHLNTLTMNEKEIEIKEDIMNFIDPDFVFFDLIDQSVFFIDASGPTTGQLMFEGFRFAGAAERVPLNFSDQLDNA